MESKSKAAKKEKPAGPGRQALKEKLRALKAGQANVMSGGNPKAIHKHRRRIHSLRRRLRKVVKVAARKVKKEAAVPAQ